MRIEKPTFSMIAPLMILPLSEQNPRSHLTYLTHLTHLTIQCVRTFPDVTLPVIPPCLPFSQKNKYEYQTSH